VFRVFQIFWKRRHVISGVGTRAKALLVFGLLLWYATSGFLYFELPGKPDLNWLDGLWWAVVTMATVGYGDLFPVSAGGRYLVGVPTMVFGIGFLGYLISEIAGALIESRSRRLRGMEDVKATNHILIVNSPRLETIVRLVRELQADDASKRKAICLLDETLDELPNELAEMGILFVKGDPTREEVLRRANLAKASHVIILAKDPADSHSDDHNLVTTLVIEKLNPGVFTLVEALSSEKIHQMELAGANSVICASEIAAGLIIQELHDPGIKDIVLDLTSDLGGTQIYFVPIASMATWTYAELVAWGVAHRATVIGIVRERRTELNCDGTMTLQTGDSAILLASERRPALDTRA